MKKIEFYFSGAQNKNLQQLDVNQSLGGYISNTPIPKNLINSLFSSLSNYDIGNQFTDTIAIFVKNIGNEEIVNLTMEQIYENLLGVDQNICKFEWGVVKPSTEGFIELIGSRKENPFYVEFFEPVFKRESCVLKILSAGQIGDTVDLLGKEIDLTSNTIESLIQDIVISFTSDELYLVEEFSNDSIYIERKEEILTGNSVQLISPGNAQSNVVIFLGSDDSAIISDSLLVGDFLGLWIKRSVMESRIDCKSFENKDKIENLEVLFSF